LKRGVEYYF